MFTLKISFLLIALKLAMEGEAIIQAIECIGCQTDMSLIRKYFRCHMSLPRRIRKNGESCIKRVTGETRKFNQWMKVCSSRDVFYEVFLCVDISRGSVGGNQEKKEKKAMLEYVKCVYNIYQGDCIGSKEREKMKQKSAR